MFLPTQNMGQTEVPDIGSGIGLLDQQKEKLIGEKVYREVHRQMPTIQDAWLEDQFLQVFSGILSQTQLGQPIGLVIIKDPQINAFAVPGGLFALNTGLITSAKNLDEIAGVMAHEIAHVAQRHYSRSQEAFKGQGLLALAGIIVGAAIASQSDSDVGSAVMLGTQAALMDKQLSYSRNQEREADRIGMQFMYAAGYNPQSMADYFETMHRATSRVSFLPDFWLTHPLTTERMSEARLRANQLPQVKSKIYDLDFDILKWYTQVVSNQATEIQLQALANQKNIAGLLALSKFYLMQGDYAQAQSNLDLVKVKLKSHILVPLIQTDIYLGQNKFDQAYDSISLLQKTMPENRALSYKLAEVLIRQGKIDQAQTLVQRFIRKNQRDIEGWQLLQQATNLDKSSPLQAVNVLCYRAEAEYWSGYEENAIKSMLHAQRLAKGNLAMSAKIDSRLKQMQDDRRMKI
ncbi:MULTISPECIES: M48 family metalloprotease [unclassified Acinetobacter]|uniref:M48 family metalloprotease n=1 Tax=unclassified Acinetobacter TaxID=196816 RepID=UPI0024494FE2|nr:MULTISPECIES: M48 family metalloprotease [unclassified Acinetobacter]MDH0031761.1 M48 family metalloprotease [Acinetobacter sp. GD04021]MDH0886076.1 M48 family metalloprotease [Acinetobacter sp. GD03873]MDH1082696.1 M48 family metalloprotease [Acinetobacter sp. GD03983]MDH2189509.1 M48 family metalloprotease [Acinetobacter sp. GD03645]MDH2203660.1 M48 family metalloprotease [Acinetobacter sp. GD03647]